MNHNFNILNNRQTKKYQWLIDLTHFVIYILHDSSVVCTECGKTFNFPNYLQKHITRVHGPKRLPKFKCRQCPLRFDSDVMLHVHMQSHPKVRL